MTASLSRNMWSSAWMPLLLIGLANPFLRSVCSQDFQTSCLTPEGAQGTCINIKQCPLLLKLLKERGVEARDYLVRSQCGFEGNYPKVCCRGSEVPKIRSTPYGPLYSPDCGSGKEHIRVVGGVPAELGAWPWITALGYRNKKDPSTPKWLCGGSLISSRHVLTAGHCVYDRNDLYIVRVGDLDLIRTDDGAQPYDVLIDKITIHPQYSPTTYTNDIAVIRLGADVPFSENLHPICLPVMQSMEKETFVRTYPFVAGWGSVYFHGPSSNHLLEVQFPLVEPEQCKNAFRNFKNAVIDDRILCAGYARGGKDACQGDSGGPLMSASANGTFYSIGVVSFGYKCGEPGFPGVYSKVTYFINFILENLT